MSEFFIASTRRTVTQAAASRIDLAVKAIDPTASFVGPLSIPGNDTTGWIERPNDGTNDYGYRREEAKRMREAMERELAK